MPASKIEFPIISNPTPSSLKTQFKLAQNGPKISDISMNIHVRLPSGAQSQYNEEQLRQMWLQGELQKGTLYWRPGMAEWRPISELFDPKATPSVPKARSSNTKKSFSKKLLVFSGLGCSGLIAMLFIMIIIGSVADNGSIGNPDESYTLEESIANGFEVLANQNRQQIFNYIHPIGDAKNVKVHDVIVTSWKRGRPTGRLDDILQIEIRYTIYWQGPLTTDGYTKISSIFDMETERFVGGQILSTNGTTNEQVAFGFGYIGGILLHEAFSE